eukprot:GEMP01013256.1.p1 GENE.GEMP01013256.1~~GEMP01013256.1.p1  ORF type:complete len:579 (+),score=142.96 GEMP01013256.1:83-1819(+)
MSFAAGSARPGGIRCGNNPSKVAVGYCPELDTPLCKESFDMLKSQPALRHINLCALHKMDEKRRRDPETQEAYTLFDTVLKKPIPTVAKLIGASKEHEVISIEEAGTQMRDELRTKVRQMTDQLSSFRLAQSQVEKLIFSITHATTQTKDEVEAYFGEFHERLERRRKEVLRELQVFTDKKIQPLKVLSERLPVMREKAHNATDKANDIIALSDLELMFRKKEADVILGTAELRLECSPDWINEAKGGLKFECDDRYLFLEQSCTVHSQRRDPDLEKCVSLVATLLGQHPGSTDEGPLGGGAAGRFADGSADRDMFLPTADTRYPSRGSKDRPSDWTFAEASGQLDSQGVRFDDAPAQGGADDTAIGRSPFDARASGATSAQEDRRPDYGRTAFGLIPDRVERVDMHRREVDDRPLRPQVFTFDANYMETSLQITADGRSLTRRAPKAVSGLCCTKQLLPLSERVDFCIEQLNLYLPGSGWVGVTPVRSLSSLQENALYIDLSTGAIINNDLQVCVANEGEFSLCEGDIISIVLHTDRSVTFYLNRRPLCQAVANCPDLVYPFVNVSGKLINVSLVED